MTHIALAIVQEEFHLYESYFLFFLETLSCYQKYIYSSLLNADDADVDANLIFL
jgi:hypothetical protein